MKDKIKKYNITEKIRLFENKWVALTPDKTKIISSGDTIDEIEKKMDPNEIKQATFMKVPPLDKAFVFFIIIA